MDAETKQALKVIARALTVLAQCAVNENYAKFREDAKDSDRLNKALRLLDEMEAKS